MNACITALKSYSDSYLYKNLLENMNMDKKTQFVRKIKEVGQPFNCNDDLKLFNGKTNELILKHNITRNLTPASRL